MIRLGLCCIFFKEPIKFRRTTARFLSRFERKEQLDFLSEIIIHNTDALSKALRYCDEYGIRDFRVNSQILPLKTHPEVGYRMKDLPGHQAIIEAFKKCGAFCLLHNIRATFHPDQFILLSSPDATVTRRSLEELQYQAEVATWLHADVINIHGGGAYGNKTAALSRLADQIGKLPEKIRRLLTLENDDRIYTPKDLLPLCRDMQIPMVYDVHHHRCLQDGLSVEKATDLAIETWNREPVFHISSPLNGWKGKALNKHHDYINPKDFPVYWLNQDITVEVEAKAKELAVLRLKKQLSQFQNPRKIRC